MIGTRVIACLVASVVLGGLGRSVAALDIVKDGKAVATVLLPEKADETAKEAAQQIVENLRPVHRRHAAGCGGDAGAGGGNAHRPREDGGIGDIEPGRGQATGRHLLPAGPRPNPLSRGPRRRREGRREGVEQRRAHSVPRLRSSATTPASAGSFPVRRASGRRRPPRSPSLTT